MKKIHLHSLWFWFVLLVIAILNAVLREVTYKPLLEPHIGNWAHQISCFTAILFFGISIYLFFKYVKADYDIQDTWIIGLKWVVLTVIFEFSFGYFVRKSTWKEMFAQYHFWKGDLWILVLIAVLILPRWCYSLLKK
jgi:hypothetical protein